MSPLAELLTGMQALGIYILVMVCIAFALRAFTKIPNEVYRKLLHCILLGALYVWTFGFETWYISVLSAVGFALVLYPVLIFVPRIKWVARFLIERKAGEFKRSLLVVFLMYGVVTTVCWGFLGDRMVGLCSFYAWGFGDAAAALVGKRFGKHSIEGKHIEGRKSWEGTIAMFMVSFLCVAVLLTLRSGMAWHTCLLISVITAAVSAAVELFSLDGFDTIMCPVTAMAVLLPLVHFIGGGI